MEVLLDTHAFVWFVQGDARLSGTAREIIESRRNQKLVSVASLWEMAIKVNIGKLILHESFEEFLRRELGGFELLTISLDHTLAVAILPPHHRDPFDRMLAAQSLTERLPLLSRDSAFDAYGVGRIWSGREQSGQGE